ncbi:MAG: aldo/keto reductase [Acidimicrobiia bacterium]|nr:aldo/keto reductase [Acidimicrobiia bacterium]
MRFVEAAGARVSVIGVGCWQFGSKDWGYGRHYARETAHEIVQTALDLGVNLIDTAEVYARGVSEMTVGRALEGRRDEAFVATKVLPTWPTAARVEEHGRLSALRLGVDTIDLYQVHWPNLLVPLRSQMEGMRRLQDSGLVANVGVSNFPSRWWAAAERHLGGPVLSNQVQYSLLHRRPDRENVPYAQAHHRIVIAYSPLAKGLLGGRYDMDHLPAGPARTMDPLCLRENVERAMPVIEALRRIATEHDATPSQIALAWLISHPNVVAIPGASSVEQLKRNVEAADLELGDTELEELTAESDRFNPISAPAAAGALIRSRSKRDSTD